jgi:hypothetical protein
VRLGQSHTFVAMSSSRRDFLKASAVALAAGRGAQAEPRRQLNEDWIKRENEREGASDWQLTRVRPEDYNNPNIEGYGSRQSVKAGVTTTATQSLLLLNSEWTLKPPKVYSDF